MSWTYQEKSSIWHRGQIVEELDSNEWRKDVCGALIGWYHYGDRSSQYGWEVDHIDPFGGDVLNNLQPLQWQNNAAKSDGVLTCVITAIGVDNVAVRSR